MDVPVVFVISEMWKGVCPTDIGLQDTIQDTHKNPILQQNINTLSFTILSSNFQIDYNVVTPGKVFLLLYSYRVMKKRNYDMLIVTFVEIKN